MATTSWRRPVAITFAPCPISVATVALPMPALAPVTSAVFPERFLAIIQSLVGMRKVEPNPETGRCRNRKNRSTGPDVEDARMNLPLQRECIDSESRNPPGNSATGS